MKMEKTDLINAATREFLMRIALGDMCGATTWGCEHYDEMPDEIQKVLRDLGEKALAEKSA